MQHWRLEDVGWARFDPGLVDPGLVPLVKAAAMVERNGGDYAIYLNRVFGDDPDFRAAIEQWSLEEIRHGEALGRWARLADPAWDFEASFVRFRTGFKLPLDAEASIRGSRTGELIARCMVETGTSSHYTALAEAAAEPVLQQICRLIAADEYRHFKLFYDHMKRYLAREKIGTIRRLRIAVGRIGESEDDELAFAYHCGNEPESTPYRHDRCAAAYFAGAMSVCQFRHIERGTGMALKAVGLPPRGLLSDASARISWSLLQRRRKACSRLLAA